MTLNGTKWSKYFQKEHVLSQCNLHVFYIYIKWQTELEPLIDTVYSGMEVGE